MEDSGIDSEDKFSSLNADFDPLEVMVRYTNTMRFPMFKIKICNCFPAIAFYSKSKR